MLKILIIYSNKSPILKRIVDILSKKYKMEIFYCNNMFKSVKKIIFDFMFYKKYNYLIAINSTWNFKIFFNFLLINTKRRIFLPYDITNFYPNKRYQFQDNVKRFFAFKIDKKLEEITFRVSDKIIHKGLKNELEFLPFYDKIKDKPDYLFREFFNPELIQKYKPQKKLSKRDGQIHLVYIGGLRLDNTHPPENFWKFYPKILNQKLHLHIYSKQPQNIIEKLEVIESNNPYFHYHGFMKHHELLKELVKYDYGIQIFGREEFDISERYIISNIAFSNKLFDYITVKLPIIASKDLKAISDFVEKYKIGITIKYKDLIDLNETINNYDFDFFTKNIDKYINNYKRSEKRFINWIKK